MELTPIRKVVKKQIFMKIILATGLILVSTLAAEAQDLSAIQNTINMTDMNSPLACTLTDSALAERKDALKKEVFTKVAKVEETDDGYMFHFEDKEELLPNLFHYIQAEQACCPFFQQEVTVQPHQSGIRWKVSGQTGVKELLTSMLEEMELLGTR